MLASVAVGLAVAVGYYLLSSRVQLLMSHLSSKLVPFVSFAAFLVRITLAVLILVAIALFTPLNVAAVGISFATLFTLLSVVSMWRLVGGKRATKNPADVA